ncbi:MAG: heme o synthase [Anaerolineae bacterium]
MADSPETRVSGRYRTLLIGAALAAYGTIVLGGVVRVSGAGLACPDWPLCHGQLVPPLEGPVLIEYGHRLAALMLTILVPASAIYAWRRFRRERWILLPVSLALVLLVIQVVLGGITVLLELPPDVVLLHLATAEALLAALVVAAVAALRLPRVPRSQAPGGGFVPAVLAAALSVYILILSGGLVAGRGAAMACPDWPLCLGELFPLGRDPETDLQLTHRMLALAATVLLALVAIGAWRERKADRAAWIAASLAGILFLTQALVGGAAVLLGRPAPLAALHLALASAIWGCLLVLATMGFLTTGRPLDAEPGRSHYIGRSTALYLSLMKPRILALLLFTTLAGMLLAEEGVPRLRLVASTLLGGALAAGGASAINAYLDRDLDASMRRTRSRPVPAGSVSPRSALWFGVSLSLLSVAVLASQVNPLAAALAALGSAYYVFVYTVWLKRSTPGGAVIGGAAGAIPPLVGWAAVTNEVSLFALFLFAIIFFWTPPHTWALALLVQDDYRRAGIPVLPAVRGQEETHRQILLYTVQLGAVTLLPVGVGWMGPFYLASASFLGGVFLMLALFLRADGSKGAARRLYKYSSLYLAALLASMLIDRAMVI